MKKYDLKRPTKKDIQWAVDREFEFLPEVDPAFAPENMGLLRKLILQRFALPNNYRKKLMGRILVDNDRRFGYIFAKSKSKSIQIDSMGVLKEYRRQGLGKQLVNWVLNVANEYESAFLTIRINPENAIAIKFFKNLGFLPYQSSYFSTDNPRGVESENGKHSISELTPSVLIGAYEKWLSTALEQGDAWVKTLIEEDFPRIALRTRARHWACYIGEEEVGYLRIAGLSKKMEAYLILNKTYWDTELPLQIINLSLAAYAEPPKLFQISFGSSAQMEACKSLFLSQNYQVKTKERYLMFKPLSSEME